MDIIITNQSDSPIYEQIYNQIKNQIVSGELKEGEALPSMRILAKELRISLITTKRAYEDLERDGYIESYTGKGSFVKRINQDAVRERILYEVQNVIEDAVNRAKCAGITREELQEILPMLYEGG